MTIPMRLSTCLDERGARFEVIEHPRRRSSPETARMAHGPRHRLAKSVIVEDDTGPVVPVVPHSAAAVKQAGGVGHREGDANRRRRSVPRAVSQSTTTTCVGASASSP